MSYVNAAAAAPLGHLNLDALQILLLHAPDLLSTRDLGSMSLCSNTLNKITDDAAVWKGIFDEAVAAGQICYSDSCDERTKITWNGEPGLLACFANSSPRILDKVGYKHAARCLLSKTCFHCSSMAGEANPLTMTRICRACTEVQESSWVMKKSKAKEFFLLTDKDCKSFLSAPYQDGSTTVLFLLSDVVAASFAKWGGPDGLESEITKHKAQGAIRYAKSQSSSKSQKKRSKKIECLSSRPGDNLVSLRSLWGSALPILASFFDFESYGLKMMHCTKCSACDVRGRTKDIVMHERLEHGVVELQTGGERLPTPRECSRTMPETIQAAEELVQLLEQAEVKYDEPHFEDSRSYTHRTCCLIALGDCKVSVDQWEVRVVGQCGVILSISYQTGLNKLPVRLCDIGFGDAGSLAIEVEELFFDNLKEALNLRQTTSSQLLAMLVSRTILSLDHYGWEGNEQKSPVFCHAWTLLGLADEHGNLLD